MIRPFTCLCAALAGASGLYLYTEKHRTTLLDQQISQIVALTDQSRDRTAMLKAEWALLSQPDRLAKLSAQFLPSLQPLAPQQFVQLASVVPRLPPKEEPKPAPQPDAFAPPADDSVVPPAAPGTDANADAVLASALPEKIAPQAARTDDTDGDDAAPAPSTILAAAEATREATQAATPREIALPAPPVRLATGRPHTQPAAVRMASITANARARIIDPTEAPAETAPVAPAEVTPDLSPDPTLVTAETPRARPRPKPVQIAHAAAQHTQVAATRHAPTGPAITPTVATVTQVAYHPRPSLPTARAVAWRPAAAQLAAQPRSATPASNFGSALGGGVSALPPPVPLGG